MYPQQPNLPPQPSAYDFIVNPAAAPKRRLAGAGSPLTKVLIVGAIVVLLLILFVGIKGALSSSSSSGPVLVKLASQQQELVAISHAAAIGQQLANDDDRNLALTTELSITSAQGQLIRYAKLQNQKILPKQLVYPNSKSINAQLAASIAASTYETTFKQILKSQLSDYQLSLKQAFNQTKGPKGRELLNQQYDGATLLLRQLEPTP